MVYYIDFSQSLLLTKIVGLLGRRYGYVSNVSKPRHVHTQLKLLLKEVKYYYQISSRNFDAALILTTTFQKK